MPYCATCLIKGLILTRPSTREYSEWIRKWTKLRLDMNKQKPDDGREQNSMGHHYRRCRKGQPLHSSPCPNSTRRIPPKSPRCWPPLAAARIAPSIPYKIGRASCRERV